MKLVVERGSRHLGHNGCQEAEVYSRGTRSHRHLQIQIHKYTYENAQSIVEKTSNTNTNTNEGKELCGFTQYLVI